MLNQQSPANVRKSHERLKSIDEAKEIGADVSALFNEISNTRKMLSTRKVMKPEKQMKAKPNQSTTPVKDTVLVRASYQKLQGILNYLDEVDENVDDNIRDLGAPLTTTTPRVLPNQRSNQVMNNDIQNDEISSTSQTTYTNLKSKLVAMTVELEQKSHMVKAMKKALGQSKVRCKTVEKELNEREKKNLKEQREEYETTIARHLSFIDRLLADKEALSSKCEELATQLKESKRLFEDSLEKQERNLRNELAQKQQAWAAAEKVRREQWTEEKTAEIKAMTVKGLEPEVQRILSKHKKDLQMVEERAEGEIRRLKKESEDRKQEALRKLREELTEARSTTVEQERRNHEKRTRELTEQHEVTLRNARARWVEQLEEERHRTNESRKLLQEQHIQEIQNLRRENSTIVARLEAKNAQLRENYDNKMDNELSIMKKTNMEERERIHREGREQVEQMIQERTAEIQHRFEQEKKNEIEKLIIRFDEDMEEFKHSQSSQLERRIEAEERKHAADLRKAREGEGVWMKKYGDLMKQHESHVSEFEVEKKRTTDLMTQQRKENDSLRRQLVDEKKRSDNLEMVLREESAEELSGYKQTIQKEKHRVRDLEAEMRRLKEDHQREVDHTKEKREKELDSLHARVKATIQRRDNTIAHLRERLQDAEVQRAEAERLLEKQRLELL
eukprot:g3984.t1